MTDLQRQAELIRLMEAYGTGLKRLCLLQLRDAWLAEDAVQETFIKAWRALAEFREESSEKTWLSRIAVNTCRDYQRTGWFRRVDRSLTPEDLPERGAVDEIPDDTVLQAVAALRPELKECVLLRYYQGLTLEDTAQALQVSCSTVKRRLARANEQLRRRLEGWCEDE